MMGLLEAGKEVGSVADVWATGGENERAWRNVSGERSVIPVAASDRQ